MKQRLIIIFLISICTIGCSKKAGPTIRYYKKDGVQWYTSKIYGYPEGKRKLAQVDKYKKQNASQDSTMYDLQESVLYYELWPNYEWKFVSKKGFTTYKNGTYFLNNDTVVVPDNVIYEYFDKSYKQQIDVYKNGKRIPYQYGRPDNYESMQFLVDTPGVYGWKDGKEYLKRKFTSEEIENHKSKEEKWNDQALLDKRLLPKYGNQPKTEEEKKADMEFIKTVLEKDSTNRKGSDHLIRLGFDYLNKDLKTAMYRFNQAWLLDSTNTDIYWGYGAVYFTFGGNYSTAKKQYLEGLSINLQNTHLWTDYGTCFLAQYYNLQSYDENYALPYLDSAITFMTKSYQIDPTDQNTTIKLSICFWNKGDCYNAWKYYDICKALGGQPITEEFTKDLQKKCKRRK